MKKALITGSFDPITNGHISLIERVSKMFDTVYVAVMINAEKKYMFDMQTRKTMAGVACEHIPNIKVVSYDGMTVDLFSELGADVIVKGVRNSADYEYEVGMAKYNRSRCPRAETLLLPADERYANVSSTAVREAINEGDREKLCELLPSGVIEIIKKRT